MKEMASRSRFETLQRKIEHARSNLTLSLMVYLECSASQAIRHNDSKSQQIAEEAQKTTINTARMSDKIDSLAKQISNIKVSDVAAAAAVEDALNEYDVRLKDVRDRLATLLSKQDENFASYAQQVQDLLPILDSDTRARRSVLSSLIFPHIDTRRSQISRAHTQTYDWILKPRGNELVTWNDFPAWLAGSEKDQIYWICGKAGSGKTTLMRELDARTRKYTSISEDESTSEDDSTTQDTVTSVDVSITAWLEDRQLIRASYYIWDAGATDQKSFHGLLRSLAHQIFQSDLSCIDKAVKHRRWDDERSSISPKPWTDDELKKTVTNAVDCLRENCRFLLLIDGLDELEGADEKREEMLLFLRKVASFPHVKLCVSSRPWNISVHAFRACPQLHLEDLTRGDMSKYVTDKLHEHSGFQKLLRHNPKLISIVTEKILREAQGVFLWVRLAVRDILVVVRDGGQTRHVLRELSRMPSDLEDYFKRMMESIEPQYRADASMILQTALCKLDYTLQLPPFADKIEYTGPDFLLVHLGFLDEEMDPYFAGRSSFVTDFVSNEDEMNDLLDSLDRRLNSRCMGLLKVDEISRQEMRAGRYLWNARIEFLHRTVRDFLLTRTGRDLLDEYTNREFDAHLFKCNTMIASVMSLSMSLSTGPSESNRFGLVACFYRQIQNRPTGEIGSHLLFDKMTGVLDNQRRAYDTWRASEITPTRDQRYTNSSTYYDAYCDVISSFLDKCSSEMSNPLSLAIELQWKSYLDAHLTRDAIDQKRGRPLLDYAIRPAPDASYQSYTPLIADIIALGASPEERWDRSPPLWLSILLTIQREPEGSAIPLKIIKAGFQGRRNLTATRNDLVEAVNHHYQSDRYLYFRILIDRLECKRGTTDHPTPYSLFELLKSLMLEERSTKSSIVPLFNDSQIEELERDLRV